MVSTRSTGGGSRRVSGSVRPGVSDSSTISLGDDEGPAGATPEDPLALVVAWSGVEPARVGEVALLGPAGTSWRLGRGASEGADWVRFARQRPFALEPVGPVEGPAISREQLHVQVRPDALLITRSGRCPMLVAGCGVERAVLVPGDTLLLKSQLLLLCVRRSERMPAPRDFPAEARGAFGQPDALGILGESPAAWRLREQLAFLAKADAGVLITGASGSGKELVARAVHALSRRRAGPFVARNAATLPPGLVDAELFGHARNFPNPGMPERPGLLGEAERGTLFLDEIGEIEHALQAHLLRVLDDGEYHRLGDPRARRADVRIVAATNRAPGALKHDFLARLPLRLALPDLDERREDVPLLVRHLLRRARGASPDLGPRFFDDDGEPRVDAALVDHLVRRAYTTHVRELDALLWRAMTESPGDVVTLPAELRAPLAPPPRPPGEDPTAEAIRASACAHGGNLAEVARALGLPSRYALYRLLKRLDLDVDELRSAVR